MSQAGANSGGGGSGGITQIDGNTGSATGDPINILGLGETITAASGDTVTIFSPRTAEFVVDPTLDDGTHQTITAALATASSGDTIFVRPGTYTEDLTLKAGVTITGDASNVAGTVINGNHTYTEFGTTIFSNIQLTAGSTALLTVSGSNLCSVILNNCRLNISNGPGFVLSNSNASTTIRCIYCTGNLSGPYAFHNITNAAEIFYEFCSFTNPSSTTAATMNGTSSSAVRIVNSHIEFVLSAATGSIIARDSSFEFATAVPIQMTGTSGILFTNASISSGSNECISYNSSGSLTLKNCALTSSGTDAITGTGTSLDITGNRNGIAFADNVDFSGSKTITGQVTTDGQLLIGSTSAPNIRVGTLASADGSVTITNSAGGIDLSVAGGASDPYGVVSLSDDFLGGLDGTNTAISVLGWQGLTNGTGSFVSFTSTLFTYVDTSHPGGLNLNPGTTSTGRAQIQCADVLQLGGGEIIATFLCKLELLSDGTDTYTAIIGFTNESTSTTITDGIYFSYTHSVNSGAWVINSVASSSSTTGNTTNTADTNWHKFEIRVNAAASSIAFYIDDVQVSTSPLTTNITTALIGPKVAVYKSAGTTRTPIFIDLYTFDQTLTAARY